MTNIIAPCPECQSLNKLAVDHQEHDSWCWAAVAQGIDHFYRPASTLTQCQVASKQQGAGNCCADPTTDTCDRRWFLEKALCTVRCLDQGPVPGTLTFPDLKVRIQQADPKPVCARIGWKGLGGHFVVIKGFLEEQQMLLIADPSDGECLVSFHDFTNAYHAFGAWTDHYFTDKVNHGNCL